MRRALVFCVLLLAVACSDDGSADAEAFCERMRDLDGAGSLGELSLSDPDDIDRALDEFDSLRELAPTEVAASMATMAEWMTRYRQALDGGDAASALAELDSDDQIDELDEAADTFDTYLQDECGIQA
jgi:hypothetical protein